MLEALPAEYSTSPPHAVGSFIWRMLVSISDLNSERSRIGNCSGVSGLLTAISSDATDSGGKNSGDVKIRFVSVSF